MPRKVLKQESPWLSKPMKACLKSIGSSGGSGVYQRNGAFLCAGEFLPTSAQTLLNLVCEGLLYQEKRRMLLTAEGTRYYIANLEGRDIE